MKVGNERTPVSCKALHTGSGWQQIKTGQSRDHFPRHRALDRKTDILGSDEMTVRTEGYCGC
jgi:hypothetical protein